MRRLVSLKKQTKPAASWPEKRTRWLGTWRDTVVGVSVVEGNSYDDDATFAVDLFSGGALTASRLLERARVTETLLVGARLYLFYVVGSTARISILGLPDLNEVAVDDFELEERPSPLATDGRLYVRVGSSLRIYGDQAPPALLGEVSVDWKKAAGFRGLASLGHGRIAVAGSADRTGIEVIDLADIASPAALGGWTAGTNFQDQLASVGELVLSYGIGNKALLYQLTDRELEVVGTIATPDRFMYHLIDGPRVLLYGGRNKSRGKGLLLSASNKGLVKDAVVSFPDETEPNAVAIDGDRVFVGSDWGLSVYA